MNRSWPVEDLDYRCDAGCRASYPVYHNTYQGKISFGYFGAIMRSHVVRPGTKTTN